MRRLNGLLSIMACSIVAFVAANMAHETAYAVSIPLFNTGVDSSGALLPDGDIDPHYTLISSDDPTFQGPNAYVVIDQGWPFHSQRWIDNGPNSKWISIQAGNSANGAAGYYDYRISFDLTGMDPSTAIITGQWDADNQGTNIIINGISTGLQTPYWTTDWFLWTPFAITSAMSQLYFGID